MAASSIPSGGFVILEALLRQTISGFTDNQHCEVDFFKPNIQSNDMLILKKKPSDTVKVFFIKKWKGAIWQMQYLKCKHYINSLVIRYYPNQ